MGRKRTIPLAKSDFPLYCSRMIGEKHLLVAGGGGSAKTGIPNAMDIYELKYKEGSLTLHKVNHYQTKSRAVMNCDVASQDKCFYLATGMEDSCSVHILRYKVMVPKVEKEVVEGVRKRKNNFTNSTNHNMAPRMVGFEIEPLDEIITDKSLDGGFQKVVRFTQDLKCFVTGGAEGTLRCWEFPSLSLLYEVQSHSNEIDDLDCSPDNKYVVTVSKDNNSVVWKLKDGSKHCQLIWVNEHLKTHRFRCCRFARIKDKENAYCLLTTHIPIARDKSRVSSFVSKWDGESFRCLKLVNTGSDILSAMAISSDGVFFGVGTISGSVSVYISFSLQRLYHVQSAHKIFVTGLEFTPTLPESKISKGADEFTMFSISADNQIVAHQMETEASYNVMWVLLGACLLIFLIVWILNIFDLFEILEYFHL